MAPRAKDTKRSPAVPARMRRSVAAWTCCSTQDFRYTLKRWRCGQMCTNWRTSCAFAANSAPAPPASTHCCTCAMIMNPARNAEIQAERLTPEEVAEVEQAGRRARHQHRCLLATRRPPRPGVPAPVPLAAPGKAPSPLAPDGQFRLCQSLCHPDCTVNVRGGGLQEAWEGLVPRVLALGIHQSGVPGALPALRAGQPVASGARRMASWKPADWTATPPTSARSPRRVPRPSPCGRPADLNAGDGR